LLQSDSKDLTVTVLTAMGQRKILPQFVMKDRT
jgi:hypothetical protein